jgi:hypothetical protein
MGVLGPLHGPGTQRGRLPSAALLGPSAPALTFNRPPIFLMLRRHHRELFKQRALELPLRAIYPRARH